MSAGCVQGFLQVDLSDDEIGMIVDTLVYDTLVDRVPQAGPSPEYLHFVAKF